MEATARSRMVMGAHIITAEELARARTGRSNDPVINSMAFDSWNDQASLDAFKAIVAADTIVSSSAHPIMNTNVEIDAACAFLEGDVLNT